MDEEGDRVDSVRTELFLHFASFVFDMCLIWFGEKNEDNFNQ